MNRTIKQLASKFSLLLILASADVIGADRPATDDFGFLLGQWNIDASFGQGDNFDRTSNGHASCDYILKKAYIQCNLQMTGASGKTSETVSLHNFNSIYGYHESLYLSSSPGWPIKVLGTSEFKLLDKETHWTNHFEFPIDDGNTEWVRAEMIVKDNEIEVKEYIKRSGESGNDWRLEYKASWTRPLTK